MDEILAMGAQLDEEDSDTTRENPATVSQLPPSDALVHEVGSSYSVLGYMASTDEPNDEEETSLDPVILAGLVHV